MGGHCKPLFAKCCIIGLGLMGASVGLALGKNGVAGKRWGYDSDYQVLIEARAKGAIDEASALEPALQEAELVILAAPVGQILEILQTKSSLMPRGALVTDVGSTKKKIVAAMDKFLPAGVTGIGGHPMAGSEQSGNAAADPGLLHNAAYILTPTPRTPRLVLEKLQEAVRAMGAEPFIMEPEAHDRMAALISHLPYLIAVTLVQTLQGSGYAPALLSRLIGNGFRDTTRIAKGGAGMWSDIILTNKTFLGKALDAFQAELTPLRSSMEKENKTAIIKLLTEAGAFRGLLDTRGKEG